MVKSTSCVWNGRKYGEMERVNIILRVLVKEICVNLRVVCYDLKHVSNSLY